MNPNEPVKLVALYFPQLHPIPENDRWWGKGFTDWVNVKKARPQFDGHFQPRVPLDDRYYDQSQIETLKWQIGLARQYGVHGFCHYHYWFDGKQLLETPTNLMLASKEIDFPFCLAWANETWSRRWDGQNHHILQEQTHPPTRESWERHFNYLIRAWSDERAIKIDGKPVFLIYRPHLVEQIDQMFDCWRELAMKHGLPGLYFIAMKQMEYPKPEILKHFDASMHFQPFAALNSPDYEPNRAASRSGHVMRMLKRLPEPIKAILRDFRDKLVPALTFYDYEKVWQHMLRIERDADLPTFPGAFVDWDNTARYGNRARIFKGASPERFAYWFKQLVQVTATRPASERIIFLNAWNEWAEGTYLEPDTRHGYRYLEGVRDGLRAQATPPSHPPGHFYSPVVDTKDIALRKSEIWPANPAVPGVEFNDESHLRILTDYFPRFISGYDYPEKGPPDEQLRHFYTQNSQFSWLDSRALFVLLRAIPPRKIIEVGSGYSSLLMADVNTRYLSGEVDITCIEPFPRDFLKSNPPGVKRIIERRVQEVALEEFDLLGENDILFIDSSHVSKTGSDVNYLFFEVLPRLAKGVRIHIHDIFLPSDYPESWVLNEARSWNEQYLLRAFLMYSGMFRVVFGCNYAFSRFPEQVKSALNHPQGHAFSGGSFWIEKTR